MGKSSLVRGFELACALLLPVVVPLVIGIPGTEDSLFSMLYALLSPILFIFVGLYVFWISAPASWPGSSDPAMKRLFARYHATEVGTLLSLAAFQLGLLFYLGDPWVQSVRYLLALSAIYIVYFVCVLYARHLHDALTSQSQRNKALNT